MNNYVQHNEVKRTVTNDTFDEGVARGGLKERADIKLLVCYLLKTLKKSLTRTQINEILGEYKVANYFEVNGAISELVAAGQIISELIDGDELITITAKAEYSVMNIERSLPRSVKEKSVSAALKILERERVMKESDVIVTPLEHGFHVTFIVKDVETELLKITVYVSDENQIELVKKNFYNSAVAIYSDIISSLTVE